MGLRRTNRFRCRAPWRVIRRSCGLECRPGDRVDVAPLQLESETLANLEDNLLLFFTGFTRSASAILEEQDTRTRQHDADMISQLHVVKQLGCESKTALERGDLRRFAELMHVHWEHKKARSRSMTNAHIDEY